MRLTFTIIHIIHGAIQSNRADPSGVGKNLNKNGHTFAETRGVGQNLDKNNPKNGHTFTIRQIIHGAIQSN